MFKNLCAEMARHNYKNKDVAKELEIAGSSFSNKLNCKTEFTISEAKKLLLLFKHTDFNYLFQKEENR